LFFRKICGFKPLSPDDVLHELASRRAVITPSSRVPIGIGGYPEGIRPGSVLNVPTPSVPEKSQFAPYGSSLLDENISRVDEEPGLQAKVESILREWINLCYSPMAQRDPQSALGIIVKLVSNTLFLCLYLGYLLTHSDA